MTASRERGSGGAGSGSVLIRPRFWWFVGRYLAHAYATNGAAMRELGSDGGADVLPTASLVQPHLIHLGHNVRIGEQCVLYAGSEGRITIGDDTLLGPGVKIFAANHGRDPDLPIRAQPFVERSVVIGRDCWLGAGSIVLPGVTVADGTVVGAGSVVTKSTEPYSVVAGNPAQRISSRVS